MLTTETFHETGLGDEVAEAQRPKRVNDLNGIGIMTICSGGIHNAAIDYKGQVRTQSVFAAFGLESLLPVARSTL